MRRLARFDHGLTVVIVAVGLALWESQAHMGRISTLFFPAPSAIASTFVRLLATGTLPTHVAASLWRVVCGFVLGGVPGLILGLATGWSRRLRAVIDPLVAALHPLPKIAILPLIMIIFGIGEASKVVVIAIASFFPMLINSAAGVRQIHPIYFEVAENYGAGRSMIFLRVVLPGSLPLVLVGLRLAMNSALLLAIAVEIVAAQQGLGSMIWFAWETLRTEELYAALVTAALLGMGINALVQSLMYTLVPWQVEREK